VALQGRHLRRREVRLDSMWPGTVGTIEVACKDCHTLRHDAVRKRHERVVHLAMTCAIDCDSDVGL
jgi:hypothetical protein